MHARLGSVLYIERHNRPKVRLLVQHVRVDAYRENVSFKWDFMFTTEVRFDSCE